MRRKYNMRRSSWHMLFMVLKFLINPGFTNNFIAEMPIAQRSASSNLCTLYASAAQQLLTAN